MLGFDNTKSVRENARYATIPAIARGTETLEFEVGAVLMSSECGVYKPGIKFIVVERWMQFGYAYYRDLDGRVHRRKDIAD